ncbi:hypothetical protein NKH60_19165 [Mesorhizobium sp. M1006]|uniref:hypothetical protein n=1 Tax=Mesorhizobium sp. M1006 TaxID=2957048 RepID=UPI00333804EA
MTRPIRKLRRKDTVGKKRESVDLLEGIPHFSPHDLRRSLTTILTDLKVRGDAASAVLDHSSGTPGEVEFQEADVTRLAYSRSQRIELKREAMEAWTTAVFEAVDKEWAKHRPVPFKAFGQVLPLGRVLSLGQGDGVPQKASSQTPLWYQEMESKEAMKKSQPRPRLPNSGN